MPTADLAAITTICFDADGTLWDFDAVMRQSLRCALDEIERRLPEARGRLTVDRLIATRDEVAGELRGRGLTHEAVRLEAFRRTLRGISCADDSLAERVTALYLERRFADAAPYEDVLPALDVLGERYRLGLLSNGNSYPERCGLAGRFAFVVFSQEHGVEKPDPRIFEIALARAGCAKPEFLMVGDSLENDVAGARRAGLASCWLNRDGRSDLSGIRPDCEVATLRELALLLAVTDLTRRQT